MNNALSGEKIIQDTDPSINYCGEGWWNSSGRSWSDDGSSWVSGNPNDYFEFTFTGAAISLWGERNSDQSKIDIYLDDEFQTTINTYSIERQYSSLLYCSSVLSTDKPHIIKGVIKGKGMVLIDLIKVYDKVNFAVEITEAYKYQNNGSLIISFNQSVNISDATQPSNYIFNNPGIKVSNATLHSGNQSVQLELEIEDDITDFTLTLGKIQNESLLVTINDVSISGHFLEAEKIINNDSAAIIYENEWIYSSPRSGFSVYGDDCQAITANEGSASIDFVGTGVSYIAETDSNQGDVEIFIDDVSQGIYSTYSDTHMKSKILFGQMGLSYGAHTFKVVKKNGQWALLDALKVYNDVPIAQLYVSHAPGKTILIGFNQSLDKDSVINANNYSIDNGGGIESISLNEQQNVVTIKLKNVQYPNKYTISINNIYNELKSNSASFSTPVSLLSTDDLLTLIQKYTFKSFWDYAHPQSGLVYEWVLVEEEMPTSTATAIGSSGFGIMCILVGIERGFISFSDGLNRVNTIVDFLSNIAHRYKGAWSHWVNSDTGETIPFSPPDNGGDIVETSYMIQGLLTARQYFNDNILTDKINTLWHAVEWNYFTNNSDVLYWHTDKNFEFTIGMTIIGWNEPMITYMLAIGSPTYPITPSLWNSGWSQGNYSNKNQVHYNITLPIGPNFGGPMFFMHYSFLGFDPRNLLDSANNVNYFNQGVSHSQIQQAYSADNPNGYIGYSDACWGLTSGNDQDGYDAHQPINDNGTITVTAALSDFPYTPEASMKALRYFYDELGEKIWNDKGGFVDGFNLTQNWFDRMYINLDQGPIIIMIENYRSGLLWKHFMTCPEVQNALSIIGFVADDYPAE